MLICDIRPISVTFAKLLLSSTVSSSSDRNVTTKPLRQFGLFQSILAR